MKEKNKLVNPLILPYKGKKDNRTLRNISRELNRHLPENKKTQVIYTCTKLRSKFNIKDITKREHQHDLIYSVKCPSKTCDKSYNGKI